MKITENLYTYIWRNYQANNCNTFVVKTEEHTCLIDPGHKAFLKQLYPLMGDDGFQPEDMGSVILTHGHPDHMEGAIDFKELGARVGINKEEEDFLNEVGPSFARMLGFEMPEIAFDFYLQEGELQIGDQQFQVIHTPGHSPGSVSLFWEDPKVLFTGDLVFAQGVGRTDFPGGDGNLLKASIKRCRKLQPAMIMPGHGEPILSPDEVDRNFEMIERMYFNYL